MGPIRPRKGFVPQFETHVQVNSYICSATLKTLGPARQWAKSLELLKGNQAGSAPKTAAKRVTP